jgi:hypothetical protein
VRRGLVAAIVALAAASVGSSVSPITIVTGETEAEESTSEPNMRTAVAHAPARLLRKPIDIAPIGSNAELNSANWSGYLARSQPAGQPYTSVVGRWTVPPVTRAPGRAASVTASSMWVGIGGVNGDQTLIQLGTEQDASAVGTTTYYAWYEMLPAGQIALPTQQYPLRPGDVVSASLQCAASCIVGATQSWALSLAERSGWDRRRPDGALWFVELSGNKIGRITIDGIITESVIPTSAGTRIAIAAGPDGAAATHRWTSHLRPNTGGLPDQISEKCCCSVRSRSLRRPGRVRRYAAATLSAGGCRCIGHQPTFRLSRLPHRSPAARNRAPSRGHESWERKHRSRQPISTSQCGRGSAKNGGWPLRDETRHSGTRCSL